MGRVLAIALVLVAASVVATARASAEEASGGSGFGLERGSLLRGLSFTSDRGPVTIRADQLEFDYVSKSLTYEGHVTVEHGDMRLQSHRLQVIVNEAAEQPVQEVVAEGNVRIEQGQMRAEGGRAVFDEATRTVVLSENARLWEGANELKGDRVIIYLEEERARVDGPVEMKIQPPDDAGRKSLLGGVGGD